MIAFFGSLSVGETILIVVIAILIFGRRLPQVAGQLTGQIVRARRALGDLRRETGIDDELREARRAVHETVEDLAREPARRSPAPVVAPRPAPERAAPDPPVTPEPDPDAPARGAGD